MARNRERGFTLVEIIVVMSIMAILVGIALPSFRYATLKARESVLKEDLFRFREAIDQYQADKGRYPESLQSLVEEGYLRRLEPDPMTGAVDWVEIESEVDPSTPGASPGIYDVKSASEEISISGEPYSEW